MAENLSVNVINPSGDLVSLPSDQVADALAAGYSEASPEAVEKYKKEKEYGGIGQQAVTGLEGAASALTFGASTGAEQALGVSPEDIRARREVNPLSHLTGQAAGLIGSTFLAPELSAAKMLGRAGEFGAEAIGLGAPVSTLAKIGSSAAKAAAENAIFQGGDELSKAFSRDPNQSAETAITNMGLAAIVGGGIGAAVGAVNPLWNVTMGPKVGQILKAVSDRMAGIDGTIPDALHEAVQTSGLNIPPEVKAGLSNDPEFQQIFKTLEQSDATKSGLELQETFKNFKKQATDHLVQSLGKTPEEISSLSDLSKYESGKQLGVGLADEFQKRVGPMAERFEALKSKYTNVELPKDNITETFNPKTLQMEPQMTPGLTSELSDKIAALAQREGWTSMMDSEIMNSTNKVLKNLPKQQTLKDLSNFITQVGNETYDFTNPQLSRAGMLMKNILKEGESDLVAKMLGEEGPELAAEHAQLRSAWKAASDIKESLDMRLHVGGGDSLQSFIKNLKTMSAESGEKIIQRLSGKNDASILDVLGGEFPETAERLKQFHINDLLKSAATKAAPGEDINANALLSQLKKMSPELRQFAIPSEAAQKIESIGTVLDQFKRVPHNFSNTARTLDKLSQFLPGSVVAMVTMLASHNPALALVLGGMTKYLSKDAPDAIRLAMLKFLGSSQPIDSEGFKAMVDFIDHVSKGESLISKASKNVFKAGQMVLPQLEISKKETERLDNRLKALQLNQNDLLNMGAKTGHYLPDHAAAMGQMGANAVNLLNSMRPAPYKQAPLDSEVEPSRADKAKYERALQIAEQPLSVLKHIKEGTLTLQDVMLFHALYPSLQKKLSNKLVSDMTEHLGKKGSVPYKTRLGLSLFMGQPLDSTMTPMGISLHQMTSRMAPPPSQQRMAPKSMSGVGKLPALSMTSSQLSESRRALK